MFGIFRPCYTFFGSKHLDVLHLFGAKCLDALHLFGAMRLRAAQESDFPDFREEGISGTISLPFPDEIGKF